jgi:hypothetical protein
MVADVDGEELHMYFQNILQEKKKKCWQFFEQKKIFFFYPCSSFSLAATDFTCPESCIFAQIWDHGDAYL